MNDLFISPKDQIANLKRWNKERKWGFTKQQLDQTLSEAPENPAEGLTTPVLVPYLKTVQQTFEELWQVVTEQYENTRRWGQLKSYPEHLQLWNDTHKPGLRWEIIDLGANKNKSSQDTRKIVTKLPHAGILAAVAHFSNWINGMDGYKVPYVDLAGYELSVDGSAPRTRVPYLYRFSDGVVGLIAYWYGHATPEWAVPGYSELGNLALAEARNLELLETITLKAGGRDYRYRLDNKQERADK